MAILALIIRKVYEEDTIIISLWGRLRREA